MLQSMGSQKVSHDLATEQLIITCRLNTQVIKKKKKKTCWILTIPGDKEILFYLPIFPVLSDSHQR